MFKKLCSCMSPKTSKKGVKLWYDPISQPCRTLKFVTENLDTETEIIRVTIIKDTRTKEFKSKVNPSGTVPVVKHDGETILESANQIRYLLTACSGGEALYPTKCIKERAKVDFWLDWNNTTGRPAFTPAFVAIVVGPKMFGAPEATEEKKKEVMDKLYEA